MTANVQSSAASAAAARPCAPAPRSARRRPATAGRPDARAEPTPGALERADVPGALDHASAEVDEFDAALVRGAGGVPADAGHALRGRNRGRGRGRGRPQPRTSFRSRAAQPGAGPAAAAPCGGVSARAGLRRAASAAATARSASCAPAGPSCSACSGPTAGRSPRRRPSCSGSSPSPALYLGLADYVAKEIVELIL